MKSSIRHYQTKQNKKIALSDCFIAFIGLLLMLFFFDYILYKQFEKKDLEKRSIIHIWFINDWNHLEYFWIIFCFFFNLFLFCLILGKKNIHKFTTTTKNSQEIFISFIFSCNLKLQCWLIINFADLANITLIFSFMFLLSLSLWFQDLLI